MNKRRAQIGTGFLLIALGILFLIVQAWSERPAWLISWPLIIVGVGAGLFLLGLLVGEAGLAVPACIAGGIGGLLYWQNATGRWESWAYTWTLIPGFVGLGLILAGLLKGTPRRALREGGWLLVISMVLFALFGSFLGDLEILGPFWPLLLILIGVIILLRPMLQRTR